MKKLISFFTVLAVLIAACFTVFPAAAATGEGAFFTLSDVADAVPGEPFTVTLHVSGNYEAHGMNLSVMYDPNCMVLEHTEIGQYLTAAASSGNLVQIDDVTKVNSGLIKIGVICPINAVSGEGDMLTMRFHIKEGVTVNQQVLLSVDELIYLPIGSTTSTPVPFTTENCVITLREGSDPSGGYNEGGSNENPTTTYAPVQPGTQPTPEPMTTPDISGITGTAAPATAAPSAGPATQEPGGETVTPKPGETSKENATANPGENTETGVTEVPGKTPADSSTKEIVIWCVAGALALAGIAAAVLVLTGKKKNTGSKKSK